MCEYIETDDVEEQQEEEGGHGGNGEEREASREGAKNALIIQIREWEACTLRGK